MRRPLLLIAAAIASLSLLQAPIAGAQQADGIRSITLSPSSTSLVVEPGVAANRNLTLINDGDQPYTVHLSVQPYHVVNEDYTPNFTRLSGTADTISWVNLSTTELTLQPRENKVVPYTITAPEKTAAGGYYAVIFAETGNSDGGGVSARNRVGNILYVTVDGKITEKGEVESADTPKFTLGNSVQLGVRVTNGGGTHFKTDAHYLVKSITGKTVFDTTLSPYVLPQTTRHITQDFSPSGLGGLYKVSRSATVPVSATETKTVTLKDSWVLIVKPQVIPLVVFAALTIIGFFLLLSRTKKHPKNSKKK